jgi:hypothetical protein
MGYDCSITKRQGCNYCLKMKTIIDSEIGFTINDVKKELIIFFDNGDGYTTSEQFKINYCPICGKKFE